MQCKIFPQIELHIFQSQIERGEIEVPECSNSAEEQQLFCSEKMENFTKVRNLYSKSF